MRRLLTVCVAAATLTGAGLALAHAHLRSSTPADHSTWSSAPTSVTLEFQEAVRLTALSLQKAGAAPVKLGPLPSAAAASFTLPLPAIEAGAYRLNWRAASDDGHVMAASIEFTALANTPPARP